MTNTLTTTTPTTLQAAYGAFTPAILREQIQLIQQAMSEAMIEGQHYGIIPGTSRIKDGKETARPTLLKPGAEKLAFMFRLAPEFDVEIVEAAKDHREYRVKCRLISITTGSFVGSGVGSCSTMESKYRYRSGRRKCPSCGSESIIQTKKGRNPGGYWCVPDKGGCNANFNAGDPDVENQETGKVENPDIADVFNTCLKMAKKRALVDAVITATAASDCFAQDLEDLPHADEEPRSAPVEVRPAKQEKPANGGQDKAKSEVTAEQFAGLKVLIDRAGKKWADAMGEVKLPANTRGGSLRAAQYEYLVNWCNRLIAESAVHASKGTQVEGTTPADGSALAVWILEQAKGLYEAGTIAAVEWLVNSVRASMKEAGFKSLPASLDKWDGPAVALGYTYAQSHIKYAKSQHQPDAPEGDAYEGAPEQELEPAGA